MTEDERTIFRLKQKVYSQRSELASLNKAYYRSQGKCRKQAQELRALWARLVATGLEDITGELLRAQQEVATLRADNYFLKRDNTRLSQQLRSND